MKSFLQYLTEARKEQATFTFGRFQPPTIGHDKLFKKLISVGRGGDIFVIGSNTHDQKKNPLSPKQKKFWLNKVAPRPIRVIVDPKIKTALHVADFLFSKGYKELIMVIGEDRVANFQRLLNNYNGQSQPNGLFFNFNKIEVVSAGKRDPNASGVIGMSASKVREFAQQGDFKSFEQAISNQLNTKEKQQLLKDLQL